MSTEQNTKRLYALHSKVHPNSGKRATIGGVLEGNELRFGIAICSPRDQFRRKTGFNKATGRAIMNPEKNEELCREGDYQGPLYKVEISNIADAGRIFGETARKFLTERGFPFKTHKKQVTA